MNQLLARANALSQQIDNLGQQYDNLKIQLSEARSEAALAREGARRDEQLLKSDQSYIDDIAVEGYMSGGLNPSLQLLQASAPQTMLNRASIMTQLQQENGAKISLVASAQVAAQRAIAAANQEEAQASKLKDAMASTVAKLQSREDVFNSEAFSQATAIFQQTGHYPITHVQGDSLGVAALNEALSMRGKP